MCLPHQIQEYAVCTNIEPTNATQGYPIPYLQELFAPRE